MRLVILGLGYAARAVATHAGGALIAATTRDGRDGTIRFDDVARVRAALASATHVLSSIPPARDIGDPVLLRYADALTGRTLVYLSSTGVYGDTCGAWVDESAPAMRGRRAARNAADGAWLALGARVLRLPGIYGPGRSALDRVAAGEAHRTGVPGQVFSRVHVDDLAAGAMLAFAAPAGAYNLSDDEPAPQDEVVTYAAALLGLPPPPIVPLSALSSAAQGFHVENRRVANGKAKRVLGWRPRYPDYRAGLLCGLRAVSATTSPASTNAAPASDSPVQR